MDKLKNPPEVLYKYRKWTDENHRNVIIKNQLFLSSPKGFNDPFDCRIPINYKLLDTPEKIKIYADRIVSQSYTQLIQEGRDIKQEKELLEYRLTTELDKIQNNHEEIEYNGQDNHLGVLSLSTRWDSLLMWAHYAECHEGFCVGFWGEKIVNPNYFGTGGPVIYNIDDDYPKIDPMDDAMQKAFKQTHHKADDWHYENEYRLTKLLFPQAMTVSDRLIIVPDDFFAEIIIGLMTPPDSRREISEVARQKGIKLFEVRKIPFKFKIDRVQI